jgi:trimethylamine--corrinoid protein Co-methyltransferase
MHNCPSTKTQILDYVKDLRGLLIACHSNYIYRPEEAIKVARAVKKAGGWVDIHTGDFFRARQFFCNHASTLALLDEGLVDLISTDYIGGYWDSIPRVLEYAVAQNVIDLTHAIALATGNVTKAIPNVAPNRGEIVEGKVADLVILSKKKISKVRTVLVGGKIVADEGRIVLLEELHFATLQILERTGALFECQEAIEILGDAGANVANPNRIKIPSYMVEQALRTAPKTITLYTREREPAIVLNGQTGSHFGPPSAPREILDPYERKRRECYVEDVADIARLVDALPNMEWSMTGASNTTLPLSTRDISDKVNLLQCILNCSKPIICEANDVSSLREMIDLCSIVAGSEENLRKKPFFGGSSEPVSPLIQGKDAMEKSLVLAEKRIPNVVYSMPMAGATTPATFAGCLAIANAEILSQLVVLQLKSPGTPVIYGAIPSIMDMKTMIFTYGAPEMSLMAGALTELCHYYKLPMFGTAGCTDAEIVNTQTGIEITYQILISALTGADLIHDVGEVYHGTAVSPELIVLVDEIIDMVKVLTGGIEINDETLPLNLIEHIGPRGTYISDKHTLEHFRRFWAPRVFDRSMMKEESTNDCEELLKNRTVEILRPHKPKSLSEDVVRELKKAEKTWLDRVGLKEYPKRK